MTLSNLSFNSLRSSIPDVGSDGSVASGQGCFAILSRLPAASNTTLSLDVLPYNPLVPREEWLSFSLFPDLVNYFDISKKSPEIENLNTKNAYYKLDDNFNELVERTAWVDSPVVTVDPLELHICPECGKQYSTSSNLARHRQTHRSATSDRKPRKCPHCDKEYISMPAYSMHIRTHSQGCICPHCGKRFSRPWLLQGHVRTHTGEKPFRCPQCAKTFADKSNLRAHIQTHSTEKPFVCVRCGKAFALKSYLYKHEESSCMRTSRFYDGLHQQLHS